MITVKQHGISTYRDVSVEVRVPLTRDGSTFFPDENWDLVFTAKLDLEDADVDAVVQKSTVAGITVDGRYAVLDIVPLDTTTLESNTILYCDVKGTNSVLVESGVFATFLWRVGVSATLDDITSIPVFTTNPPAGRQLSNIATSGYTAGRMLRIASAGGLEERTTTQVLSDIGVPALEMVTVGGDPNTQSATVTGTLSTTFGVMLDAGTLNTKKCFTSTGDSADVGLVDSVWWDSSRFVLYAANGDSWESTDPVATPDLVTTWIPNVPATGDPTVVLGAALEEATHIGQWCRVATADPDAFNWWQWNGTVWIPRFTDAGEPIAYNATLSAYRKLTVTGADGAETITISAL